MPPFHEKSKSPSATRKPAEYFRSRTEGIDFPGTPGIEFHDGKNGNTVNPRISRIVLYVVAVIRHGPTKSRNNCWHMGKRYFPSQAQIRQFRRLAGTFYPARGRIDLLFFSLTSGFKSDPSCLSPRVGALAPRHAKFHAGRSHHTALSA